MKMARVKRTLKGSVPHPVGDHLPRRPRAGGAHGFVERMRVEHQAVVETSGDDVHLERTKMASCKQLSFEPLVC